MFDTPVDAWYIWLGVTVASFVVFGVATELPTSPPPDATRAANTVDVVAGCEYTATAEHPLSAREIKLGRRGLGLRGDDGSAHATFAHDSVVPIEEGTKLWRLLRGEHPSTLFDSSSAFRSAARDAQNGRPTWKSAESTLLIRCVSWEGVDATLVSG
ncbi:DUF7283 family protein [Haladaptatus caseinilyticus]|uniref:DUF7283 family protein n=1 Tax=Haladaptatus caseinilyticus TaxID=2993314 RepID=UPI00224A9FAD|nr:hypothetical protein [Haladaptatus caseinilyticus]